MPAVIIMFGMQFKNKIHFFYFNILTFVCRYLLKLFALFSNDLNRITIFFHLVPITIDSNWFGSAHSL